MKSKMAFYSEEYNLGTRLYSSLLYGSRLNPNKMQWVEFPPLISTVTLAFDCENKKKGKGPKAKGKIIGKQKEFLS
jgi:hypothetical protein